MSSRSKAGAMMFIACVLLTLPSQGQDATSQYALGQ